MLLPYVRMYAWSVLDTGGEWREQRTRRRDLRGANHLGAC